MENRYDDNLRDANQAILSLIPANVLMRYEVAREIGTYHKPGMRVLEIGGGEGDSAEYVLKHTEVSLDFLDIAPEMIDLAKERLKEYENRVQYITADALEYLQRAESYDIIFSEWTIHNFKQKDKEILLTAIFAKLKPGGVFILMDKVWPKEGKELMELQLNRYRRYLAPEAAREIIEHEHQDAQDEYRMDEENFLSLMKETGFDTVSIVDRVERDVIIIGYRN